MLSPANAGHHALISGLIRECAAEGAFDPELTGRSLAADVFFANLQCALHEGRFTTSDAAGHLRTVPAHGYIYVSGLERDAPPAGFGMFKSLDGAGFELWLTAIAPAWRGNGHGRAMITAMLATPAGRMTYLVRVNPQGSNAAAMSHLLCSLGFSAMAHTTLCTWYLADQAPPDMAARISAAASNAAGVH